MLVVGKCTKYTVTLVEKNKIRIPDNFILFVECRTKGERFNHEKLLVVFI